MSVALRAVVVSDLGLLRPNNEDEAFAGSRVIAVADGIGGGPAGEVASRIAIRALAKLDSSPHPDPVASLRDAIETANREIGDVVESDPASDGMGTTLTAILFGDETAALLHIGDSRGYLLRERKLHRLTRDDTYVQSLVDEGLITSEAARHHPHKSLITASLQGRSFSASLNPLESREGDRYLLCSDGLSDIVTDDAIADVLRGIADVQACAERLVKLALQAGAPDNVTVVVGDTTDVTAVVGDTTDESSP
jgi:serine/threonine protein phosphatase PrpC